MTKATHQLSALLVDPALFTGPYDAAVSGGLEAANVEVRWVTRPLRRDETQGPGPCELLYYRGVEQTAKRRGVVWRLRKLASHLLGGLRLLRLVRRGAFDLVHFQWTVLPLYDAWLMRILARTKPVILTVHDPQPFNGAATSKLQTLGFDRALRVASRIIVHTGSAREALIGRGHDPCRLDVIAHGPLTLGQSAEREPGARRSAARPPGAPWRVVLFGKLQPYKGIDILIEAMGRLSRDERERLRVVIAGEPLMPMARLRARAAALALSETVDFRLRRQGEAEMAALFDGADAFVFPYRRIAASGVLHLVLPYRKWIVASDLGAFRDLIADGCNGQRVPPGNAEALAAALVASIGSRPRQEHDDGVIGWDEIGRRTRQVYERALFEHTASAPGAR